jgi:hypothetical protein
MKATLDWAGTTGSARKWWDAFERENSHRLGLVLRLAEELVLRKATLTEFFLAYVYSNTDNIQANLHYLDYTRLKKEEEKRKKEQAAAKAAQAAQEAKEANQKKAEAQRFRTGEPCPSGAEGPFVFDGYLDGSADPAPETREITLEASQVFPAGTQDKPCWWKKTVRDQRSATGE